MYCYNIRICDLKVFTSSTKVEENFLQSLNSTVEIIKSKSTKPSEFKLACNTMTDISVFGDCCGYYSTQDFNKTIIDKCCHLGTIHGCADRMVVKINSKFVEQLLIPNIVSLVVQFITFVFILSIIFKSNTNREERLPLIGDPMAESSRVSSNSVNQF